MGAYWARNIPLNKQRTLSPRWIIDWLTVQWVSDAHLESTKQWLEKVFNVWESGLNREWKVTSDGKTYSRESAVSAQSIIARNYAEKKRIAELKIKPVDWENSMFVAWLLSQST